MPATGEFLCGAFEVFDLKTQSHEDFLSSHSELVSFSQMELTLNAVNRFPVLEVVLVDRFALDPARYPFIGGIQSFLKG
ncbi:MAG: hypothetical protein BWY82_03041 [Verrucomicrobia bacterium ADurb.Bin474]|nr:MAG: hypothetical protein BWY82_03041 [Verrucomicrobia bacterium ADurb.Bin474]